MIQLIAMLTMLVDHIGIVVLPDAQIMRIIGRMAFPIYAFGIVQGYKLTRDRGKYLHRLLWLSAVSQIPFMAALRVYEINVIGTFAVCLAVLLVLDRTSNRGLQLVITLAAGLVLELLPYNYGIYALLLMLIYRYADGSQWIILHGLLNLASWFVYGWLIQLYSILSTVMIKHMQVGRKIVPRWLWQSFYPAHLALLAVIQI